MSTPSWITSIPRRPVVNATIGAARHFDYRGIEGFSTTNYSGILAELTRPALTRRRR